MNLVEKAEIEAKRNTDGTFSKTDLVDLKKNQQVYILQSLGIEKKEIIEKYPVEEKRVRKILYEQKKSKVPKVKLKKDSEVKEKKETKVVCDVCSSTMKETGGGPSGTDYECKNCGYNLTK